MINHDTTCLCVFRSTPQLILWLTSWEPVVYTALNSLVTIIQHTANTGDTTHTCVCMQ